MIVRDARLLADRTCGRDEKAFKAAFMTSPSHSPGRGMLEVTVMACAYAVSDAARACKMQPAGQQNMPN